MKALLAVAAGLLTAVVGATPAQAHNSFTGSNPKDGARVAQAPETVTLRFLATLDQSSTTVEVTGPGGVAASTGKPGVKGNRVSIGVRPGAAGEYTVTYRVASRDGHPIKGKIRFTVTSAAPVAGPAVSAGPVGSAGPVAGAGPDVAVVSSAPADPAVVPPAGTPPVVSVAVASRDDGRSVWPWLLGVAALIAVALGAVLLRRRRTTT